MKYLESVCFRLNQSLERYSVLGKKQQKKETSRNELWILFQRMINCKSDQKEQTKIKRSINRNCRNLLRILAVAIRINKQAEKRSA